MTEKRKGPLKKLFGRSSAKPAGSLPLKKKSALFSKDYVVKKASPPFAVEKALTPNCIIAGARASWKQERSD